MSEEQPVIYTWDLETGFNKAAIFSLFNKYLPHTSIVNERYIICATFKNLLTGEVKTVAINDDKVRFKRDPTDDLYVVAEIYDILKDADAVIAHYGDKFDTPFLNSRLLYHGMSPLPNMVQIDTYKMAKSRFNLNSNKLDYIANFLGIGKKIKTDAQLWLDCLDGVSSAVEEMVLYNIQDVEILEDVYHKMAPFCPSKLNMNHYTTDTVCPSCGSVEYVKKGFRRLVVHKYQEYMCKECSHRFRGSKAIVNIKGTENFR